MEQDSFIVSLEKNPRISIKVQPGHFATASSHTNYYLDVSGLKTSILAARDVARELAIPYMSNTLVDTIVCMENTEIIGAYLAEELAQDGTAYINSGDEIRVVMPSHTVNGQWVFQDSMIDWIRDRNIVLLIPSISSGRTVRDISEAIEYYSGNLVGISVLFLVSYENISEELGEYVHTVFTADDIPGFKIYNVEHCEMCKEGRPLEALINSEGYKGLPIERR